MPTSRLQVCLVTKGKPRTGALPVRRRSCTTERGRDDDDKDDGARRIEEEEEEEEETGETVTAHLHLPDRLVWRRSDLSWANSLPIGWPFGEPLQSATAFIVIAAPLQDTHKRDPFCQPKSFPQRA